MSFAATTFFLLMIMAGVGDALSRRIPNGLILVFIASFFSLAFASGLSGQAIGIHVSTGMVMLLIGYGFYASGLIGGGDAKLLAVAALWFGYSGLVPFLMMTAIAGGALALVIAGWSVLAIEAEFQGLAHQAKTRWIRPSLPYGFAIASGAILASPQAWWGPIVPFWSLLTTH